MKLEDKHNAVAGVGSSGKVHKVAKQKDVGGIYYSPACNPKYNLGVDGWTTWVATDRPVNCKHCLRIMK